MSATRNKTIDECHCILDFLAEHAEQWQRLPVIADRTGVSRDRCRRFLTAMAENGWVQIWYCEDGPRYILGAQLIALVTKFVTGHMAPVTNYLDTLDSIRASVPAFRALGEAAAATAGNSR